MSDLSDLSDWSDWSDGSDGSDESEGRGPVVLAAENGCFGGIWGNFFLLFWIFFVFLLRGILYLLLINC